MDNTTYEFFIRRAWKCDRFKKGANTDTWENLCYKKYIYEKSIGTPNEDKTKKDYDKKMTEIKQYVDNAYQNLLFRSSKLPNNGNVISIITDLRNNASNAVSPEELFDIMNSSFQIMNDNNL